jgi:hypothetical protein
LRLLLRILVVIPLGFVAACIAAAALLTFAASPQPQSDQLIGAYLGVHAVVSLIFAAFIGFLALVPA